MGLGFGQEGGGARRVVCLIRIINSHVPNITTNSKLVQYVAIAVEW